MSISFRRDRTGSSGSLFSTEEVSQGEGCKAFLIAGDGNASILSPVTTELNTIKIKCTGIKNRVVENLGGRLHSVANIPKTTQNLLQGFVNTSEVQSEVRNLKSKLRYSKEKIISTRSKVFRKAGEPLKDSLRVAGNSIQRAGKAIPKVIKRGVVNLLNEKPDFDRFSKKDDNRVSNVVKYMSDREKVEITEMVGEDRVGKNGEKEYKYKAFLIAGDGNASILSSITTELNTIKLKCTGIKNRVVENLGGRLHSVANIPKTTQNLLQGFVNTSEVQSEVRNLKSKLRYSKEKIIST